MIEETQTSSVSGAYKVKSSYNIEIYFHPCWPSYRLEICIINNDIIFKEQFDTN